MSVCSCEWDGGGTLGSCVLGGGPRTARKDGYTCPNCNGPVIPGQRCVDFAGLNGDDHSGFFYRMHEECYRLMTFFSQKVCGDEYSWSVPFDLVEASRHAVAESHQMSWRWWLDLYEETWKFSPEPPDPSRRRVQRWRKITYPLGKLPPVPRVTARLVTVWEEVKP